ncbi:CBS domain-containing protein [Natrinema longum]|uniref:CBS domain-containing protein n=1 Tax=Natrinema longum TaxID=370324 RepID=A0A8A2UCY7_9EURY|nr:CBS domain-containing protein [Natrinema longum]MBZ6495346.1 CBS domain-containing protein [Natrinema longum]QSW86681.1 CBS domain-containing protein [Natrinema longum]
MHDTIPVTEIMIEDVVTASPDTTVTEAATVLRDESVSSVLVVRDGDPVGIVTEGDFATHLCDRRDLGHHELSAVMSTPLTTIEPTASIVDAVELCRSADIEHLPVVSSDDRTTEADESATTSDQREGATDLLGIVTTIELSYYVPQLVHRPTEPREQPPRRQVRSDTLYERDDWEFEYRGEDESTVSVGDSARFSKLVSEDDVEAFAAATGDTNRVHLDGAYAAETRFGERIVHGVLANGLISAALARLPGLTIYLSQESSFRAPLAIGEQVTAVCEVVEALGGEKYRIETTVSDGDGTVVLEGDAVVLVDPLPPMVAREEVTTTP